MKLVNKKIIGIILIITLILSVTIIKNISNKNIKLDEVKLINKNNKSKIFAIMLQQEDGTYKETNSNSFNQIGYIFNNEKSGCIDNEGNKLNGILTYNDSRNTVLVQTSKTVYCYVYYDKTDDLKVAIKVNGFTSTETLSNFYDHELNCSYGMLSVNNKYRLIEFNSSKVDCTLNYKTPTTTYPTLKNKVETVGTSGTGSIIDEGAAGYRYEGQNPNNYVWFNNELWRVIGSVPVCLTASCGASSTNLVKIIRNSAIGTISYDGKKNDFTGAWGSNTLYTLLNHYYYLPETSAINTSRTKIATNTDYCYGWVDNTSSAKSKSHCDYSVIGIDYNSYYGQMIENVYWNTGASGHQTSASSMYLKEKNTQTVEGYIGLMNASDYGYATSASHSVYLSAYNDTTHTLGDWLYSQSEEWTITQYTNNSYALVLRKNGYINIYPAPAGYAVRPVVYLNPEVYVISGTGTISDPYIIGMS